MEVFISIWIVAVPDGTTLTMLPDAGSNVGLILTIALAPTGKNNNGATTDAEQGTSNSNVINAPIGISFITVNTKNADC